MAFHILQKNIVDEKTIYSTLKQCAKMIDGFDPKEFLDKQIKKNILEKKIIMNFNKYLIK